MDLALAEEQLLVQRTAREFAEQAHRITARLRQELAAAGVDLVAAPVSGNAKVVKAGKLAIVASGPRAAFEEVRPHLAAIGQSVSYVGEGDLARIVKVCHNVFLGVVIQSLCEVAVLAQKAGVPRHAFLDFMNQSVLGSVFTRYKTPALVNLDFAVTFTPELLRKDLDLGLDAARRFAAIPGFAGVAATGAGTGAQYTVLGKFDADGKKLPVKVKIVDTESDPTKATVRPAAG